MRHLGCQGYLTVNVALQTDGNQLVRVRGKVFPRDELSVTLIAVSDDGRVDVQTSAVVLDFTQRQILDVQRAQRLVVLRVRTLYMQLQRIGELIVFVEKCLTYLWDPLVGIGIEIPVHRFSRPEGDVVQIDDVVVTSAIDQCTHLSVADGQRLFEKRGWLVVIEHHWCLLLCCCHLAKQG